jgi:hypothetical protein
MSVRRAERHAEFANGGRFFGADDGIQAVRDAAIVVAREHARMYPKKVEAFTKHGLWHVDKLDVDQMRVNQQTNRVQSAHFFLLCVLCADSDRFHRISDARFSIAGRLLHRRDHLTRLGDDRRVHEALVLTLAVPVGAERRRHQRQHVRLAGVRRTAAHASCTLAPPFCRAARK